MGISKNTENNMENSNTIISLLLENQKSLSDIKNMITKINEEIAELTEKIQEFEIIFDAAEIIEEQAQRDEEIYGKEWNPYDDEDFTPDFYEDYDSE
jgi:methyl-accepting chemotaxis protein